MTNKAHFASAAALAALILNAFPAGAAKHAPETSLYDIPAVEGGGTISTSKEGPVFSENRKVRPAEFGFDPAQELPLVQVRNLDSGELVDLYLAGGRDANQGERMGPGERFFHKYDGMSKKPGGACGAEAGAAKPCAKELGVIRIRKTPGTADAAPAIGDVRVYEIVPPPGR